MSEVMQSGSSEITNLEGVPTWESAQRVGALRRRAVLQRLIGRSPERVSLDELEDVTAADLVQAFGKTFSYNRDVLELDIESINRKLGSVGIKWFGDRVSLPDPRLAERLDQQLASVEGIRNYVFLAAIES